jgi:hypothetical protein
MVAKSEPALNSFPDGAAAIIEGLKQQGIFPENDGNS